MTFMMKRKFLLILIIGAIFSTISLSFAKTLRLPFALNSASSLYRILHPSLFISFGETFELGGRHMYKQAFRVAIGDSCGKVVSHFSANYVGETREYIEFDFEGSMKVFCDPDSWNIVKIESRSTDAEKAPVFGLIGKEIHTDHIRAFFSEFTDDEEKVKKLMPAYGTSLATIQYGGNVYNFHFDYVESEDHMKMTHFEIISFEEFLRQTHGIDTSARLVRRESKTLANGTTAVFATIKYPVSYDYASNKIRFKKLSIMETEVTQMMWVNVMNKNPSIFKKKKFCPEHFKKIDVKGRFFDVPVCPYLPISNVSYKEITEKFLEKINANVKGGRYRLPTMEEWLLAAYGGDEKQIISTLGNLYKDLERHAWYAEMMPQAVMQLRPNRFGIYDMLGNVWEWTSTFGRYTGNFLTGRSRSRKILGGSYANGWNVLFGDSDLVEYIIKSKKIKYPRLDNYGEMFSALLGFYHEESWYPENYGEVDGHSYEVGFRLVFESN